MPFTRKFTPKRLYKRKPKARKIYRKRRITRPIRTNIKSPFLKTVLYDMDDKVSTLTAASQVYSEGLTFSLSQFADYTKFTQMFEQYKINAIMVTFFPPATNYSADQGGAGAGQQWGNYIPTLYAFGDPDDSTAPTTVLQMLARPSMKCKQWNKPFTYKVHPHILYETNNTTKLNRGPAWIDTDTATIPHYALKYLIDCQYLLVGVDSITYNWTMKVSAIISFKGLKYSTDA